MQAEASFPDQDVSQSTYAVLARVSPGYPPLPGRLPTCYSPVRRSPEAEASFAHDLHVLSTPPAFILSQDQTLQFEPFSMSPANGPTDCFGTTVADSSSSIQFSKNRRPLGGGQPYYSGQDCLSTPLFRGRKIAFRQRPTLPHTNACSTIGAEGLNCRVRKGNGCFPLARTTGKASN